MWLNLGEWLLNRRWGIVALIDFLLTLTDERVRYEQAPFDHPEVFVPLNGTTPENTFGRPGFLDLLSGTCPGGTGPCFRQIPAVGAGRLSAPVDSFMQITNDRGTNGLSGFNCFCIDFIDLESVNAIKLKKAIMDIPAHDFILTS